MARELSDARIDFNSSAVGATLVVFLSEGAIEGGRRRGILGGFLRVVTPLSRQGRLLSQRNPFGASGVRGKSDTRENEWWPSFL